MILYLFLFLISTASVKATFSKIAGAVDLLRGIEANSVELRMRAQHCRPLLDYLIELLWKLAHNLYGYDGEIVIAHHSMVENCIGGIKEVPLSPAATRCVDGNLLVARQMTRSFLNDSTCLRIQIVDLLEVVKALLKSFLDNPIGNCPIPIICAVTRPGLSSLVVSVGALINLLVSGLRLISKLLQFYSNLQYCRKDFEIITSLYNTICENGRMCSFITA